MRYYPGNRCCDYVGLGAYSTGIGWRNLRSHWKAPIAARRERTQKPIVVGERRLSLGLCGLRVRSGTDWDDAWHYSDDGPSRPLPYLGQVTIVMGTEYSRGIRHGSVHRNPTLRRPHGDTTARRSAAIVGAIRGPGGHTADRSRTPWDRRRRPGLRPRSGQPGRPRAVSCPRTRSTSGRRARHCRSHRSRSR